MKPRRGTANRPRASAPRSAGGRVVLGVTGGIAAYKAADVIRGLTRAGCAVHVIMTEHARHFITPLTLQTLSGHAVLTEPWDPGGGPGIQHIELARQLDLMLVAPATANILAKLAHGVADDFLSTFYLAVTSKVVVAPAMNLWMWKHPATRGNIETLRSRGTTIIDPGVGELACGDEGVGRMAEPETIVRQVLDLLGRKKKAPPRLRAAGSS